MGCNHELFVEYQLIVSVTCLIVLDEVYRDLLGLELLRSGRGRLRRRRALL